MQKLTSRHGVGATRKALRFMDIRLRSRPETAALADDISAERTKLYKVEEVYQQAHEERVAASAEIVYLDACLDAAVSALAREAMVQTGGRRDAPLYLKLFPKSPSTLMRGLGDSEQDKFVKTAITTLRADADCVMLRAHADELEARQRDLEQAVARRDELYVPEARAEADLRLALDRSKRAYNLAHARLQLLFPGDPILVESFFARVSRRGGAERDEDRSVDLGADADAPLEAEPTPP